VVVPAFELRASHFLSRHFTIWATPGPFCFSYFSDRVPARAGLNYNPTYLCLLCSGDYKHVPSLLVYWWNWGLTNFLPRLASNCISPNLCLPRSWDYSHESPYPAINLMNSLLLEFSTFLDEDWQWVSTMESKTANKGWGDYCVYQLRKHR
jgi:hypothetical protein